MSIEKDSKWVKDGEVVELNTARDNYFDNGNTSRVECVWFWDKEGNIHVLTERDFLEQYKPYEPVYEYKYVIGFTEFQKITNKFYKSDEELMSSEDTYGFIGQNFQRLDFTKRERKQ